MKKIALFLVVALLVGVAPAEARVKKPRGRKARTTRMHKKSISRQAGTCEVKTVTDTVVGMDEVYEAVDVAPAFPGGEAALIRYLSANIQYPPEAAMNNVQGRVMVQFIVGKTGAVSDVRVVRSLDPYLDREAVRVCKSLPDFTPGLVNGQPVKVFYTLPISFKLTGDP